MRETESPGTGSSIGPKPDGTSLRPDTAPAVPPTDPVFVAPARARYEDPPARTLYEEPVRLTYAEAPILSSAEEPPPLFSSTVEDPPRRGGLGLWFTAAASLVLGIVIGFASGYRAGQGSPAPPAAEAAAPTSGSASRGQPFSESTVSNPTRLEEKEIVPSPPPVPAPSSPAPAPASVGRTPSAPARAPDPGLAAAPAPRGGVARSTTTPPIKEPPTRAAGPGSLQVLSRPVGAEVFVDGRSVGRTPLSIEADPGRHDVRLALPGFNPWQTTVDVKPGSPTRVSGSLEQVIP